MLATPLDVVERRRRVLAECKEQQLGQEETGKRLLEVDPEFPAGLLALGTARLADRDFDGAEPLLWRALAGAPSNPGYYFPLMALYRERQDSALMERFAELTWWKLSFYDEIPKTLAAAVAKHVPGLEETALNPAVFRALAEKLAADGQPWPERLLPYRLLNDVQRQQGIGLSPELVAEVREHGEACLPLFQAAIREGFDSEVSTLWSDPEAMLLALLGEIGGAELIGDLVLLPDTDHDAFYHAQWAAWRLGQRFPAEAFERLGGLANNASVGERATIAQHLYLLPDAPGARAAILALLDGFASFATHEEAWYLLETISMLMSMKGSPGDARAVRKRWERHLSKDGRRMLLEAEDSEDGFVPDLIAMAIDELDVNAVCCDHALMEEHENDEEEYVEPARVEKPGRNDPCWCGSGKKYKKCHLSSDEESVRAQSADDHLVEDAWRQMLKFARGFHSTQEVNQALRLYFDRDPLGLDARTVGDSGYAVWYLLEYRPTVESPTVAAEFLRRRGGQVGERLRAFISSLADSRLGLWEVRRAQRGSLEVEEVFGGEALLVEGPEANAGEFAVGRVHRFGDRWRFAGDEMILDAALAGRLREEVERGSAAAGVAPGEWFRSQSHGWWRFLVETGADMD